MTSISGLQNNPTNNLNTIDGLQIINATDIYDDGVLLDTSNLVPYIGATQAINVGAQAIKTTFAPIANNDVVNLLTLENAIEYIEGVNVLNFVKYTGSTADVDLGTYKISSSTAPSTGNNLTNKTYVDTQDALKIPYTGSTADVDLGTYKISSSTAPSTGNNLTNKTYVDTQDALKIPYTGATTNVNLGSNTITASTAKFTAITSATPTLALGVDASGNLNTFAVPSSGSIGGTVSTRFIPYASATNTLANSLFNQIDNDSMGFGYTAIPNYPLGSGGKNMYINGSIFAGGFNSMVGTFGRDTNTSNPANEITFTAGGAGTLLTQVKSHSGSSAFVDATWTYSNTNPAPLGANQGQILLQADKLTMALTNGLIVNNSMSVASASVLTKLGGNSGANYFNIQGNDVGSSPYLGFYFNNLRRCYIGNATATEVQIACENGAQLNLLTAGTSRMTIDSTGITTIPSKELRISNATSASGGQIRLSNGTTGYGNLLYNDGSSFFFLLTNNNDVNGNFNALRPLQISGASGRITMSNGLTVGGDVSLSGNVFTGTGQGRIYWLNPNGAATHWGYPSGGGSDNYIRGTFTYIDTPIVFNSAISINGPTYPQNTSDTSHVMTFNQSTSAVQRSQCMMRQYFKNENIAWTGGFNYANAFYKHNTSCPVRISGRYSYYTYSAGSTYIGLRIFARTTGVYYYYTFHHYQNFTYGHTTYPLDFVLYGSDLPTTGWFDTYIYNSGGPITSDGNDQLQLNVMVLPVDSF